MEAMTGERRDKAERLLNLTLALLATKRPLAKEEILETIPGYSGNAIAKERMFERDKDELREMGIKVEVLPIDPLFEDELGYRILPQDFFLPEILFTVEESLWLSLALNLLRGSDDFGAGQHALQKLFSSTSGEIEQLVVHRSDYPIGAPLNRTLDKIWSSIARSESMHFLYSTGRESNPREVSPYIITSRTGHWYLVAQDHSDCQLKTFRIDRIDEVYPANGSKDENFRSPNASQLENFLKNFKSPVIAEVRIRIREELSVDHPLVRRSSATSHGSIVRAGEEIAITRIDPLEIREMILWSGASVEVLAPLELRQEIIESLKRVIEVNK